MTPPSPGLIVALAILLVPVTALCRWVFARSGHISTAHLRGRALNTPKRVRGLLSEHLAPDDPGLQFGRHRLPSRLATGHMAVIGATGSGKTLLQRLLMQSALPLIGRGFGHRALVYDAKQDALPILSGMALPCPIHVLNPLAAPAVAWDMATDITSPAAALQVASLLIPANQRDSNPFFSNAARHLLYGALLSLIQRRPGAWTLRDLLLIVRNPERLRTVLSGNPYTVDLLQYFEHEATMQNILSTVLTYTAPYEIIAAAWHRANGRLSLRGWLNDESILVLGNDEANRAAIDTINQLIFKRLSELILAQPEVPESPVHSRRTWVFLDEVRQAGRLDGLSSLMTKGRSKGAAVVLGLQDISGLRDVYGREVADELVGQCNTKAILRLNSPETAAWASQLFGSREVLETRRSSSRSRNFREAGLQAGSSSGESVSNDIAKRDAVLESEFLDLDETTPENGLSGFFLSPVTGAFFHRIPGEWISANLKPPSSTTLGLVPRPEAHQYLLPWSPADDKALRHPPETEPATREETLFVFQESGCPSATPPRDRAPESAWFPSSGPVKSVPHPTH